MRTRFCQDVTKNEATRAILARWNRLDLPQSWLVAGCLFQTVWNIHADREPAAGIKDYDLFYFDDTDPSAAAEAHAQSHVEAVLADLGITVEVANQARVHLWYEDHFARPYPVLAAVEDGIDRFLVLETCVGIRPAQVYAPYGLEGLYAWTLTPNPLTPYPELFNRKVQSYRQRWGWLSVQTCPQEPPATSVVSGLDD